jgi:hypothetical protein
VFPQALIQGALARLGMHTTVTCESSQLPQCEFPRRGKLTAKARSRSALSRTHQAARTALAPRASSAPCLHQLARLLYRCHVTFDLRHHVVKRAGPVSRSVATVSICGGHLEAIAISISYCDSMIAIALEYSRQPPGNNNRNSLYNLAIARRSGAAEIAIRTY